MTRIIISATLAAVLAILIYLALVFFVLTNNVVPIWILGVVLVVNFVVALAYDIVTTIEEPESRSVDEE